MSGQRTSPHRTLCFIHFLFLLFPIASPLLFVFLAWMIHFRFLRHIKFTLISTALTFFSLYKPRDCLHAFLQFPRVLTAFSLLNPSSPQAEATEHLLSPACVRFFSKCFIWYVVHCIRCGTLCDPMTLAGHFEDEHIVLINQSVRPSLVQITQGSKELSGSDMVLIEVTLHSFYTLE